MKKALHVIVSIIKVLVILALIAGIVFLILFPAETEEFSADFMFLGIPEKPELSDTLPFEKGYLPDENDMQAKIAFAVELYEIACLNYKNAPQCLYAVDCKNDTTVMPGFLNMKMTVNGYRYQLKTDTEYYYTEYSVSPGGIGKVMEMLNLKTEDTMFAIRSYTNSDMDYLYTEKSLSPQFITDEETGELEIVRDWSEGNMVTSYENQKDQPIYNKNQVGTYYQTDQTINANTVISAEVSYNEKGGFYVLVLELDVNNPETTKNSIGNLQAGAGESAKYDSMVETIEIWDNGYFRTFLSLDEWSTPIMTSVLDYSTTFYYDDAHMITADYMDFDEIKSIATAQ